MMRNLFVLSVLILFFGLLAAPAWSEVERVELRVDGLACPFCAYGLEKKLKDVAGVEKVEIKVDEGRVILDGKKGESIAVDRLEPAVKDAGFTAREMTASVVGTVETVSDRRVLRVSGSDTQFLLEENETLKERLIELKSSQKVRVIGELSAQTPDGHPGHPYTLRVEKFERIDSATD